MNYKLYNTHQKENSRYDEHNITQNSSVDLSISYKNYFIDEFDKRNMRLNYGEALKQQMKQNEGKRAEEKKRKLLEDQKEEDRIRRERELMEKRVKDDDRKRMNELERFRMENERLMNMNNKGQIKKEEKKEIPIQNDDYNKAQNIYSNIENKRKELTYLNENFHNNLLRLKNNLINQQNEIFKSINDLRNQNIHGNFYKDDLKNELNTLREEIKRKRYQINFQNDYMYQSLVDTKNNKQEMDRYLDDIYLNKSHHIINPRTAISYNNRYYVDPSLVEKYYKKDKFDLHEILNLNERRLTKLKFFDS